MQSNKDYLKIMSRERDDKNMKICQVWGRGFTSLSQKYEERVWKFFFLARHKQNYIVTFISLSLVNICQNYMCLYVFLDPQCIVSQEDFQHKILNWSTLLPLLVTTYK